MTGVNRAVVIVGIVAAGALTLSQARDGDAMTNGLVWGSQKAVQGAQRVFAGMSRAVGGLFYNNDVWVTFYVSVPEDVGFLGKTVNGDILVHDLASDVGARSVNGDIEISTTGFAEARTVNGSIDAAMERYDIASGLSFSTVNGSISLDLPNDVDADLDARWVNGRLETDLPLQRIGRVSRRSARGVFGDGVPEFNLRTVNGSIHVF